MKFLIIPLLIITAIAFIPTFCDGYKQGYIDSSTYGRTNHYYRPQAPECPAEMAWENNYQDGYNRGFLEGLEKRGYLKINR